MDLIFATVVHGAELVEHERAPILAKPGLPEEGGSRCGQSDEHGDGSEQGREYEQARRRDHEIEEPLAEV
jgi:hypothetical protein